MIKRAFDCGAAVGGLVLLLPVFAIVAIVVKLDSPGPVFFCQERVGRWFRSFRVFKFRTMTADAESSRGSPITFGGAADARITRAGRVLRRMKLDELPQLVNVLIGDMSLVGPRPEVRQYVEMFHADYETILVVRPGMTDFASLAYRDEGALLERSADPAAEYVQRILPDKIRLSQAYVRQASLAVDLRLVALTVFHVWGGALRAWTGAATLALVVVGVLSVTGDSGRPPPRQTLARSAAPTLTASSARRPIQPRFASPTGTPHAAATLAEPLDLATALSRRTLVQPGETLWLRGGRYRGPFVSHLTGTLDAPIEVRSYPGERAVIDGAAAPAAAALTVNGSDTLYRDFEVTNTDTARDHERGIGVNVFGPRVRLINLVVHDTGNGIGVWTPAVDAEIYGDIIYNVGWEEHTTGKGHSIYVQNEGGTKRLVDNVLLNGYSFGIHAYSELGHIDHLYIAGNVAFNHGLLSSTHDLKANILVGGRQVAVMPALIGNFTYQGAPDGLGLELGYWAGCKDARVTGNYLAGGIPLRIRRCHGMSMNGNRLYGRVDPQTARQFPDNAYAPTPAVPAADVFVRPNAYERGRATVIVYNWQERASIDLDLSAVGLASDEPFEIRDAQNYAGSVIVRGVYRPGSPIALPMTQTATTPPIGANPAAHTRPEFGVFVVQPLRSRRR
jgi:lipopolysaccharide/colanic/teichoic acid biosynthesis glycosyltransferase